MQGIARPRPASAQHRRAAAARGDARRRDAARGAAALMRGEALALIASAATAFSLSGPVAELRIDRHRQRRHGRALPAPHPDARTDRARRNADRAAPLPATRTMVTQQSAAAKIGRHSSALRLAMMPRPRPWSRRIALIVDERRGKPDRGGEALPEILLQRARRRRACRRSSDRADSAASRRRASLRPDRGNRPVAQCPRQRLPGEGEHRVGHGDVEMAALPGLVALAQRQQDVDHRRKGAAADVGDQRRRHHRPVRRPGLQAPAARCCRYS